MGLPLRFAISPSSGAGDDGTLAREARDPLLQCPPSPFPALILCLGDVLYSFSLDQAISEIDPLMPRPRGGDGDLRGTRQALLRTSDLPIAPSSSVLRPPRTGTDTRDPG